MKQTLAKYLICSIAAAALIGCSTGAQQDTRLPPTQSGTAVVDASENPLSINELWEPLIDGDVLADFLLSPANPDCTIFAQTRVCNWLTEKTQHSGQFSAHVFSSKISFTEVRRQPQFTDFQPATVAASPALRFLTAGDGPNLRCNLAWGNSTGSVWVTIGNVGGADVDSCATAAIWAEAVHPVSMNRTTPQQRTPFADLWNPEKIPTDKLANWPMYTWSPATCETDSRTIRTCRWQERVRPTEKNNGKIVHIYSGSQAYLSAGSTGVDLNSFTRSRPYISFRKVTIAGKEAVQFSTVPETCTVAWASRSGTAWVRGTYGRAKGTVDERPTDLCGLATKFAGDIHPDTQ